MNIEKIKEAARKNTERINNIKLNLEWTIKRIVKNATEDLDKFRWRYNPREKKYFFWTTTLELNISTLVPMMRESVLYVVEGGVHMDISYDPYDGNNTVCVYFFEEDVNREKKHTAKDAYVLMNKLAKRRAELFSAVMGDMYEGAKKYLLDNEKEFCRYPTAHVNSNGHLIAGKTCIVWTCGGIDEETKEMNTPESQAVRKFINKITYTQDESLQGKDSYYPVVFDSDEQTEKVFRIGSYIDMIVSRKAGYHDDVMCAPALYVTFILADSSMSLSPLYKFASEEARSHYNNEFYRTLRTFIDELEEQEWIKDGYETAAYVPIANVRFIDRMICELNILYSSDEIEFRKVYCRVPIFSPDIKSPCIRVAIK